MKHWRSMIVLSTIVFQMLFISTSMATTLSSSAPSPLAQTQSHLESDSKSKSESESESKSQSSQVPQSTKSSHYHYEKIREKNHVIHYLRLPAKAYTIELVKSDKRLGRETVSSLAMKKQADIAINGGFFEIGGSTDGNPSGSLVINGKVYQTKNINQALFLIQDNTVSIKMGNPKKIARSTKNLNKFSLVSGLPLLVENSRINPSLSRKKTDFYLKPHARTALGLTKNRDIIIVVAEQHSTLNQDPNLMTVGEMHSLLKKNSDKIHENYKKPLEEMTMAELKAFLKEEFQSKTGSRGLTLLELAEFMKSKGSDVAINLDGGGSSTLWIDNKVINQAYGDEDEDLGKRTLRPVSDAIVFKYRQKN